MTANEYLNLDIDRKVDIIWENGSFIDEIIKNGMTFRLFSVEKFYAEVIASNVERRITDIVSFESGERLDKYLKNKIF